jgi:hypothetical protein
MLKLRREREPCGQCIARGIGGACKWLSRDKCYQCDAYRIRCCNVPATPAKNDVHKKPIAMRPIEVKVKEEEVDEEVDELEDSEEPTIESLREDRGPNSDLTELKEVVREVIGALRKLEKKITVVERRLDDESKTRKRRRIGD